MYARLIQALYPRFLPNPEIILYAFIMRGQARAPPFCAVGFAFPLSQLLRAVRRPHRDIHYIRFGFSSSFTFGQLLHSFVARKFFGAFYVDSLY